MSVVRTFAKSVDDAIAGAALRLLGEHGFARLTMEAVAREAGVGKPALYRRFDDKAGLVAHVISSQLPRFDVPDLGDTQAELRLALQQALPTDGPSYVRLIGGLIAEQDRHPELIDAFRAHVLLPRRALGRALIERGQARGELRTELDPDDAIDLISGPFLARVFAGLDTGPSWRERAFNAWWDIVTGGKEG